MRAILAVLATATIAAAWTDISMPNTFVDSGIIYASEHNENDSTAEQGVNDLADTMDVEFIRYDDLNDGDSTLLRVQLDTIRSNPDVDSLSGNPWVDSLDLGYLDLDTLRGNPDADSLSGYPFIDSVASGFFNVTKIAVDTIVSNPYADSIEIGTITGGDVAVDGKISVDTIEALDVLRGNPDVDSLSGSPEINAATVTGNLTLSNTTATRLLSTNGSKVAASTSVSTWVGGTSNQVTVTDDGDGTATLSTPQDIASGSAVTFATVNTGQGANELYDMDQNVLTTSAPTFATVNTGNGANELHAMDQDVQSSDAVTFATVNTGQGANELYDMDQNVQTTSGVEFARVLADTIRVGVDTVSLASNVAVASGTYMVLDTEGDVALDTLTTLNGSQDGQMIFIQTENGSRDVFIDSGEDNVSCGADRTLNGVYDSILLIYVAGAGAWKEVIFADNN